MWVIQNLSEVIKCSAYRSEQQLNPFRTEVKRVIFLPACDPSVGTQNRIARVILAAEEEVLGADLSGEQLHGDNAKQCQQEQLHFPSDDLTYGRHIPPQSDGYTVSR